MNRLSIERRKLIVSALCEGNSIRATARMSGASINTVMKLLVDLGTACAEYHDKHVRNIKASRVQCDEIWAFVGMKEKNVPAEHKGTLGIGDAWTWTGIDADSKLIVSYMIGKRDLSYARIFIADLAERLAGRVQLTTDGLKAYLQAVEDSFGCEIDYAQLVKIYGSGENPGAGRYSPAAYTGSKKDKIEGNPDPKHISTSYVERQNLSMRMGMRRFTRLTNGFSKKLQNLECAVALYFMHYNFVRIHTSLRTTPAMAAGVTNKLWEIEDLIALLG